MAAMTGVAAQTAESEIATTAGQIASGSPEVGSRRFGAFTGAKSAEPPS